jgi:iron-sulfur cluster assembly protein
MSYEMNWVEAPGPQDETVTSQGLTVLVDRKATLFLIGTTMDYREDKLTRGFTFENPNEKGRCGCGESFHV